MLKTTDVLFEVLGCPSDEMREPVNADYLCPFIEGRCIKRGHNTRDPFPLCSLWRYKGRGDRREAERPVIVCPKRFFQARLVDDVLQHCWPQEYRREYITAVREIKMGNAGNVDMVICDISNLPRITDFISVEIQAIDITGSVSDVYSAHINGVPYIQKPKYDFNRANVFKRYLTQLIKKGYFHSTWGKKIVAVVQDLLLEDIRSRVLFPHSDPKDPNTSIIFMAYSLDPNKRNPEGFYELKLKEVVGTHHSALMSAVVYEKPPEKDKFIAAILRQLEY